MDRPKNEKLNKLSKDALILLYQQLFDISQKQYEDIQELLEQNEKLQKKLDDMGERLSILIQKRYGRSSEKAQVDGQLSFDLETMEILNEAEKALEGMDPDTPEPCEEEVICTTIRKTRPKGKRKEDLSGLPREIVSHELEEKELTELFPRGYKRLPDEVSTHLEYEPAKITVREDHIAVYASKGDDGLIVKADRPVQLLRNSLATSSLVSAVIEEKYADALPLNRISENLGRRGIRLSRQVLARWMVSIALTFLAPLYEEMKKTMIQEAKLIHCDETPFKVVEQCKARGPDAKCFMWLYHSSVDYGFHEVYLYEYQPTRKAERPREFLKGFSGVLVTDGFQAYHTLAKERPDDLTVAGCWVHAKRKYTDILKALGKKASSGSVADQANRKIQAIFHVENMVKGKGGAEKLEHRQSSVKPLVDAYFAWIKETILKVDIGSNLYRALNYSINQEKFLREFLDDPMIPIDNNAAERSIRKFCVGKHSWHLVESEKGAEASAILYSLTESAKGNELIPFEYFKYILDECAKPGSDPTKKSYVQLLPWSADLPESCRSKRKEKSGND